MKAWAVMMRTHGKSWIDTLWVEEASANKRHNLIKERIDEARFLTVELCCWVAELRIEDANMEPNDP
jgi:steroid 5-alpha reductase family enzyme